MSNLSAFIVMRVLSAYATGGMMLTAFVLMMEFVGNILIILLRMVFVAQR